MYMYIYMIHSMLHVWSYDECISGLRALCHVCIGECRKLSGYRQCCLCPTVPALW